MSKALRCGLIGHNVSYSKSSDLFTAMFDMLDLQGSFATLNVVPSDLERAVRQAVADKFDGLCVTIPHKRAIMPLLDELHPAAEAMGAVNSLAILEDGRLQGHNTDCYGFSLPLQEHAGRLKHGRALIIGCGGGARAVVYGLYTDYELHDMVVLGRTKIRMKQLRTSLSSSLHRLDIQPCTISDASSLASERFDIIVNCTPLGGWNYPRTQPLPASMSYTQTRLYYDLNYNPDNVAVASAREAAVTAIDGSLMLAGQAVRSMEIWSGHTVSVEELSERVFGR